jgi:putative ABC transport system permease protein
MLNDLRYAVRVLFKQRGFTAVALTTLALGIGANTAIFSIVHAVLLRPLPFTAPEGLYVIWGATDRGNRAPASEADFLDWRSQNRSFDDLAALDFASLTLSGGGEPEQVPAGVVSASMFNLLGLTPVAGRVFTADEDRPEGPPVVVLGYALWQRRFGGDRAIVGKTVALNGRLRTVVGVMPPNVDFPGPMTGSKVELWVPIALDSRKADRGMHYMGVLGRLKPEVSLTQARDDMAAIARRIEQQYPETNTGWRINIVPLHEQLVGDVRPALLVLMGAVGFVLLIACANVANLLLARGTARAREIAVRGALGASRARLLRQLLTESLLLAAAGSAVGLLLAMWTVDLLPSVSAGTLPRLTEIRMNGSVFAFALAMSVITGVLFGLAPAWQATLSSLNEALKIGGRAPASAGGAMRSTFVVVEIALACVLLIGAALLIRSLQRLEHVDPGFRSENVLTASLSLPDSRYRTDAQRVAFLGEVLPRIRSLPNVEAVGATSLLPLGGSDTRLIFTIEGEVPQPPGRRPSGGYRNVSDGYFSAMGIPLVRGRGFSERDTGNALGIAVINKTLAQRYFANRDPLGRRIKMDVPEADSPWLTIVGIVGDVKHRSLAEENPAEIYTPFAQNPTPYLTLVARTRGRPSILAAALRGEVRAVDPGLPFEKVRGMDEVMSESVAQPRFRTMLLGCFAGLALVLASVGVYGVMAYSVQQRWHEMGLRMALGARPRDVVALVVGSGLRLTAAGIGIGVAGALAVTKVLSELLFGISPTDPGTFAIVAGVLAAIAGLASYIPARRATRADPMMALRAE